MGGALKRLAMEAQAYTLYVIDDLSSAQVGHRLGVRRQTAADYIRAENERRAYENQDRRGIETEKSIALYRRVIQWNLLRMEHPGATGWESRAIISARTRIDQLLGLDAAVSVRIRDETPAPAMMIGSYDPAAFIRLLQLAMDAKGLA